MPRSIVTLTTDFGYTDPYVGVLKAVILNLAPEATVVDISHGVGRFSVGEGALVLGQSYRYFPAGSIHLVVVDPGVGSARRPLLVSAGGHRFIAPDNGVLSLVYRRESEVAVRHITAAHYFLPEVSNTFHGRDIFAPIAGWLARGIEIEKFGELVQDYVRLEFPSPKIDGGSVCGTVLRIDGFGNLVTNFEREHLPQLAADSPSAFSMTVGSATVTRLARNYTEIPAGELAAIWGSAGLLEISAHRGSAAAITGAKPGAEINIRVS